MKLVPKLLRPDPSVERALNQLDQLFARMNGNAAKGDKLSIRRHLVLIRLAARTLWQSVPRDILDELGIGREQVWNLFEQQGRMDFREVAAAMQNENGPVWGMHDMKLTGFMWGRMLGMIYAQLLVAQSKAKPSRAALKLFNDDRRAKSAELIAAARGYWQQAFERTNSTTYADELTAEHFEKSSRQVRRWRVNGWSN